MSHVMTQGNGPFNILVKWRAFTEWVSPNLGLLFRCMLCLPTNIGIVVSLLNWFLCPLYFTPFNMIFADYHHLWWLGLIVALMDGFAAATVCFTLFNFNDYIDKNTPIYEDEK